MAGPTCLRKLLRDFTKSTGVSGSGSFKKLGVSAMFPSSLELLYSAKDAREFCQVLFHSRSPVRTLEMSHSFLYSCEDVREF